MLLLAMSALLENGITLTFVAVSTTQVVFVVRLMAMIGTADVVVVAVAVGPPRVACASVHTHVESCTMCVTTAQNSLMTMSSDTAVRGLMGKNSRACMRAPHHRSVESQPA